MVTDPLTGAYSRATLEQRLHEEIERSQRYGIPFSIILLDLDHYKSVNDAFGHLRGDQVLTELVARLRLMIRKSDIIFRYGGDEFLVLLPNTAKSQASLLAQRLLEEVRDRPFGDRPPLSLSISLGVSSCPDEASTPEALFEKADQRHYEAKRRGRGRVMAEDIARPQVLPFDAEARLVERDDALVSFHRFLNALPEKRRGLFSVSGSLGSGRARFLSEVMKVARLQGYEVIAFRGSPALKNRTFGDLAEVCKNWDILPSPSAGEDTFGQALQRLVEEKGRTGVLFVVENLPETDWFSLELLRSLMLSAQPSILIGLVYSADIASSAWIFPHTMPLVDGVVLGALTREGFLILMRMMMHWEAPPEFREWLYQQTGGLPAFLQTGLTELIERDILERSGDGWTIAHDYSIFSLKDRLGLQAALPPNNLPAAATGFVGRSAEIQEAKDLLSKGRLLTLVGPGGVGKTRLSLQVAAELLPQFPQGVYWVPLASLNSTDYMAYTIAEAVKFSFYSPSDPTLQLIDFLREKQMLLVLDNFEHLTQGSELVAQILEQASRLKILVTSRERLNLSGEAALELSGMSFPSEQSGKPPEIYPAVQLFVQSARRSDPDFNLDVRSKKSVARICKLVEGLPLGIELAAGWIRVLSCSEIAEEIQKNLDFLSTPARDLPARHRSLRAVFEHSWNLLLNEEQLVLSKMAIFRGGFRREAAARVAGASLAHISTLLDKSLLRKISSPSDTSSSPVFRYELHETLRQYAQAKLKEWADPPGLYEQTVDRMSEYYAEFLSLKSAHLSGERQKETLESVGEEIENVRAAWSWCAEKGRVDLLKKALPSLYFFYEVRGLPQEGDLAFQKAEESLQTGEAVLNSLDAQEYQYCSSPEKLALTGQIIARRGVFNHRLTRYELAKDLLERGLAIFRFLDNRVEIAFALQRLSQLQTELGEYEAGRRNCQESLEIYRDLADRQGIGRALNELGAIAYRQGEYDKAEQYHRESLRLFRELNDRWGLASTLVNLGNVETELGEYEQARQFYRESLALCEEIGAQSGLAATLNNLGDIAREIGDLGEARKYLNRSIEIYQQIGDRYGLSVVLANLGEVAYRQEQFQEARNLHEQSLAICEQTGNRLGVAHSLAGLGALACAQGQYPEAEKYYLQALKLAVENRATPLVLETLVGIAVLSSQVGEKARALELLLVALQNPATMKVNREEAEALRTLLESQLSPLVIQEAKKEGQSKPLEEIIHQLIGEKCQITL
ncbi:MAG TPA: tetratricopeptide repeat protein [Anaerolineales bacterium]